MITWHARVYNLRKYRPPPHTALKLGKSGTRRSPGILAWIHRPVPVDRFWPDSCARSERCVGDRGVRIPARELVTLDRARVPDRRPVLFRAGADRGAGADNRAVVERRVHPRHDDPAAAGLPRGAVPLPAVAAEPRQAE